MTQQPRNWPQIWPDPTTHLTSTRPDHPVLYLSLLRLQETARRFLRGFPGLVSYAVKANDRREVLETLVAAGIRHFDVASPAEMRLVRDIDRGAVLHYNNPVRSTAEVEAGIRAGVSSWSVDHPAGLAQLAGVPRRCEISVRIKLPVGGAAYDFGDKFGATPPQAVALVQQVARGGWSPALCFHPGTQCADPAAWESYIHAAAEIARRAGVRLTRLNVGGGFPASRGTGLPALEEFLTRIRSATAKAFGDSAPQLVCEPGRAMVAEAGVLATRVKQLRDGGATVYLNDGIYGGLAELRDIGLTSRLHVMAPDGTPRRGKPLPRTMFGPTCDSLDRLPDGMFLPDDMEAGDYLLFEAMGAYSVVTSTGFNGYGLHDMVSVERLTTGKENTHQ